LSDKYREEFGIKMVIKIRKSGVFSNPLTQFTKENAAYYPLVEYRKIFKLLILWALSRTKLRLLS